MTSGQDLWQGESVITACRFVRWDHPCWDDSSVFVPHRYQSSAFRFSCRDDDTFRERWCWDGRRWWVFGAQGFRHWCPPLRLQNIIRRITHPEKPSNFAGLAYQPVLEGEPKGLWDGDMRTRPRHSPILVKEDWHIPLVHQVSHILLPRFPQLPLPKDRVHPPDDLVERVGAKLNGRPHPFGDIPINAVVVHQNGMASPIPRNMLIRS